MRYWALLAFNAVVFLILVLLVVFAT